jgi:hypothetical protein
MGGVRGFRMPDGVPTPPVWFMPEQATLNGTGHADVLLNQGIRVVRLMMLYPRERISSWFAMSRAEG